MVEDVSSEDCEYGYTKDSSPEDPPASGGSVSDRSSFSMDSAEIFLNTAVNDNSSLQEASALSQPFCLPIDPELNCCGQCCLSNLGKTKEQIDTVIAR